MHTPLFIKTHNSLLQSLLTIPDIVEFAKKNNIQTLGIVDNTMYGVLDFYKACQKNHIQPIIGLEVGELTLFAKNYQGYQNLIKLATISSKEEITIDTLKQYKDEVIAVLPFHYHDCQEQYCFYQEWYQGYYNLEQRKELKGNNLIYASPILYLEEKDREYLPYLYAIDKGIPLTQIEIDSYAHHFFNFQEYEMDADNYQKIIDACKVELPMHQDLLPVYECPNGMDSFVYLKQLVKEGLQKQFGERVPKTYVERLKYELDVINKMGFCNYFLVVADYVKFAKEHDILVGPGRGSAAGSLVSYCLNITTIDPIKYQLFFERFLNPERISMPDIDIDFEYTRREEVLNYCIEKYGSKRVAPIITFGTLGSKQVVRDVGRSLELSVSIVDGLAKMLDSRMSLLENYRQNPKIKAYLEKDSKLQTLYKVAMKLEGLKRHTSIHAAGVVMSKYDLDTLIPLTYHDNLYITGYSMEHLEELGLLKMDFLALRNLTLIHDILEEIPELTFDTIPLEDKEALQIFTNVDTIGIFQFESSGMMNFLRKFRPSNFEDIVAALALFRPGPMGNIDAYIRRKNGQEKIDYLDDSLISILKPTYGIIVYQEQIMQIANVLAGYSLAEADVLRKAMSKKKEDVLLKEKDKFIHQSIDRGYSEGTAKKVYDLILKFASYGFNRAHSVAYAMIAYKMAYLKAHYPMIFIKHLLSMVIGSEIKTKEYITTFQDRIRVSKPSINLSENDYIIIDNQIIYPFTNIKNVGSSAGRAILEERKKGKFKDIFDFFARCYGKSVNSKVIQSLIMADCFKEFGFNQKTIEQNLEILTNYSELGELLEDSLKPELVIYPEYSKQELLDREMQVFGTYLSSHPVLDYRKDIKAISLKKLSTYFNQNIKAIIYVEKVKKVTTKKEEIMLFITGSDETSLADFVLFPNTYMDSIQTGDIYIVDGKVEKRFDKYQVIVKQMTKLNL